MQNGEMIKNIEKKTCKILVDQVKSVERSHPKVHDCHLSITKIPTGYITELKGKFDQDPIQAEANDAKLLRSFIKASHEFNSAIQSARVKQELQESFADYPVVI